MEKMESGKKNRDELAKTLKKAPKNERINILKRAKEKPEYRTYREEKQEFGRLQTKLFKELDDLVRETEGKGGRMIITDDALKDFLDTKDMCLVKIVPFLKEKLKLAVRISEEQESNTTEYTAKYTIEFPFFIQRNTYYHLDRFVAGQVDLRGRIELKISGWAIYLSPAESRLFFDDAEIYVANDRHNYERQKQYEEAKKESHKFVEWLIKDKPDFSEAERTFAELSKLAKALLMMGKHETYSRLISEYVNLTTESIKLAELTKNLRSVIKYLEEFDHQTLIKDLIILVPANLRRFLVSVKDLTVEEALARVEKDALEGIELDSKRYNLHRFIEFFAFKYLYGQSAVRTRWDIERKLLKPGEAIPITSQLFCSAEDSTDFYTISFGEGEEGASGYHAHDAGVDIPAKLSENDYSSKISPGRSFYEDSNLVAEITELLIKKYPLIKIENHFRESGSFHEIFRSFDLLINKADVFEFAHKNGLDPKSVLNDILKLIRERVHKIHES